MDINCQRISYFVERKIPIHEKTYDYLQKHVFNKLSRLRPDHGPTSGRNPTTTTSNVLSREKPAKAVSDRIEMLLSKVTFHLKPGTVTVLFGSGYESQRKLIEILALRQTSGYLSGKILYDSVARKNGWFKDIVHIKFNKNSQLSERYYNRLSVFEYLYYGARLRISYGVIECRERTRNAIKLVGLDSSATVNTLTASELRMLSIAVELVGNPTLLCLENPIDGLDASGSIEVMSLLRKVAKRSSSPVTIVYVIKFLDYDMLRYIDNVLLFTEHKLVRFQDISKGSLESNALEQIKALIVEASVQLKSYSDAAAAVAKRAGILGRFTTASKDHINGVLRRIAKDIDTITIAGIAAASNPSMTDLEDMPTPPRLVSLDSSTPWNEFSGLESLYPSSGSLDGSQYLSAHHRIGQDGQTIRAHKPIYIEIFILVARGWKHYFKNALLFRMYFGRLLAAGVLIGLFVWHNGSKISNDDDYVFYTSNGLVTYQVYNITSTMFILASVSIVGTVFAIMILHTNIQIMKYEIASGLHHTFSCWLSLILVDLPIYLTTAIILASIVWGFIGLYSNPFHAYIGTMILITIAGYSLALAVVVWSETSNSAMLYFSIYGSFSILFTGYLQAIPDLTNLYQWATTTAFSRWAFEALMLQSFQYSADNAAYLDSYGFNGKDSTITFCIEWLIVWCLALQGVVLIGLFPPIYDTNFFKDRYGNRVNRRLIQEALEMDEDDVVVIEELDSNTDRNRHAGSVIITSPLTESLYRSNQSKAYRNITGENQKSDISNNPPHNHTNAHNNESAAKRHSSLSLSPELVQLKEVKPIPVESQVVLTFEKLKYVDKYKSPLTSAWNETIFDHDPIETPAGSFSSIKGTAAKPTAGIPLDYNSRNNLNDNLISSQSTEPIFQCLNGTIIPSQSCCILDSSNNGTGKVLLQILSSYLSIMNKRRLGKTFPGQLYGSIKVLGLDGSPSKYCNSVYIPCGDIVNYFDHANYNELPSSLTVKEVLTYSALLRRTDQHTLPFCKDLCSKLSQSIHNTFFQSTDQDVPSNMITQSYHAGSYHHISDDGDIIGKSSDVQERVNEILAVMGLNLVANTIIGPTSSKAKGILPAQLRCLSIATEIVNRPNLIFLEDPFHGLDWFDCQSVAVAIQNLSRSGRTVIASLERPRSSAVYGFDQMLLLGSGLLLYNGPSLKAASYFENIGYERRSGQSPLEFTLDVALDRGKLKKPKVKSHPSSKSNNPLGSSYPSLTYQGTTKVFSLEDLADICQSLFKSYIGPSDRNRDSADSRGSMGSHSSSSFSGSIHDRGSSISHISDSNIPIPLPTELEPTVITAELHKKSGEDYFPPIGPNVRTLLSRGFYVTFSNRRKIIFYWLKYFAAGCIVGSIWWALPVGDYEQRIGLLATSYLFVSIVMVDLMDGIFERKELFLREARSGYSSYLAYWLSDSAMAQVLNFIGSWLFVIPAYTMTKLRNGPGHVIYFYIMIIASIYCNLGLAYVIATITPSSSMCKIIFNGFLMPLQVFMSGYLILLSSLEDWEKWGAAINPMSYYLAGVFVNEFDGNDDASGDVDYDDLKDLYDFHLSRGEALWAVLVIGVGYRLIWLLLLAMWDSSWRYQGLYRTKVQAVRRKARKIATAAGWKGNSKRIGINSGRLGISNKDISRYLMEDDAISELESSNITTHTFAIPNPFSGGISASSKSGSNSRTGSGSFSISSGGRDSRDIGREGNPTPRIGHTIKSPSGKTILEQLHITSTDNQNHVDQYVQLSDEIQIINPLGRSNDSIGESSGHIDL